MVNHLSRMGIQRWQQRSVPSISTSTAAQLESCAPNANSDENTEASSNVYVSPVSQTNPREGSFSAYAAKSVRLNESGGEKKWLWVVPQPALPTAELQLLDKIVAATGSNWESSGVADNYVAKKELNIELQQSISAIIILGNIEDDWKEFFDHQLYQQKRFFMGTSLREMMSDGDKKRLVWNSLQALM